VRGPRRPAGVRVPEPAPGERLLNQRRPQGLADLDDLDALFAALAHPVRRHVLQVLHARGGSLTAGELARRFSHSWPTTTRQLRVLEDAGLVVVATVGRERHFSLERKRLSVLLDLWCTGVGLTVTERGKET
jgi:DNA-binding transcriptional ArsR family regulator